MQWIRKQSLSVRSKVIMQLIACKLEPTALTCFRHITGRYESRQTEDHYFKSGINHINACFLTNSHCWLMSSKPLVSRHGKASTCNQPVTSCSKHLRIPLRTKIFSLLPIGEVTAAISIGIPIKCHVFSDAPDGGFRTLDNISFTRDPLSAKPFRKIS